MISKQNLQYTLRNILARKMRSGLTIFSIFLGIATVFIFVSFGFGLYSYVDDFSDTIGLDKLIIQAKGFGAPGSDNTFKLTDSDIHSVQKTRGVDIAAGVSYTSSKVIFDNEQKFNYAIGYDVSKQQEKKLIEEFFTTKLDSGRELQKGDTDSIVVGSNYAKEKGVFTKKLRLGDKLEVNGNKLRIVGFYKPLGNPSDDANIYLTQEGYARYISPENNYAMIIAKVHDYNEIELILDRVTKELRHARGQKEGDEDFFVQTPADLIAQFKIVLNVIIGFIILIALVSVFVSAVNTANTMVTSVIERTQEIGVIKSIGARNSDIFSIFLLESSLLGLISGILGVLAGYGLSSLGGAILESIGFGAFSPAFPLALFIGCIVFATIVGAISGVVPAYSASKQKPVDALRYE